MRAVVAPEAAFERFFPEIARALLLAAPAAPQREARPRTVRRAAAAKAPAAPVTGATFDDLLASIFAVAAPGGEPSCTAFLLQEPRVVVCDAFAAKPLVATGGKLLLIAADGRRYETRALRTNRAHPFGPTLLEAPAGLVAPGLRISSTAMTPGEVVQIAVAAGEKTGVSVGAMTKGIRVTIAIEPVGRAPDLASMNAVVRPGASGAPVVDQAMAVRGFIVAGSTNEENPTSFMYPCRHWIDFVTGGRKPSARVVKKAPARSRSRRTKR
jgi:hypothetical protein